MNIKMAEIKWLKKIVNITPKNGWNKMEDYYIIKMAKTNGKK